MKRLLYPWIKWLGRFSLLSMLALPALKCSSWRMGRIDYDECGKIPMPMPEMPLHLSIAHHPLMGCVVDGTFLFVGFGLVYMLAEYKYGQIAPLAIGEIITEAGKKWYVSAPVIIYFASTRIGSFNTFFSLVTLPYFLILEIILLWVLISNYQKSQ